MSVADRLEAYLARHAHHVAGALMCAVLILVTAICWVLLDNLAALAAALALDNSTTTITADCPPLSPGEVFVITGSLGDKPVCNIYSGRGAQ